MDWDVVKFICGIFLGAFALVAVGILIGTWFDSIQCNSKATTMKVEHSWGFMQGCMIEVNGKIIPLKSYVVIR